MRAKEEEEEKNMKQFTPKFQLNFLWLSGYFISHISLISTSEPCRLSGRLSTLSMDLKASK